MEDAPTKKKRCSFCQKRATILMECNACKHHFCIKDRLPEGHQCPALEHWKKTNPIVLPKIVPMKIDKV